MKSQTISIRMSPEAQKILLEFQQRYGLSRTAVFEMALRMLAQKEAYDSAHPNFYDSAEVAVEDYDDPGV